MSTHDLESLAIEMVARQLGSFPALIQRLLMQCDPITTVMFEQILANMGGRLE